MAFFTRVNLNVPVLPPEDLGIDGTCPTVSHRRYLSEPISSVHGVVNSTTRPNSVPGGSTTFAVKSSGATADQNTNAIVRSIEDETTNTNDKLTKDWSVAESNAKNTENDASETLKKSVEKSGEKNEEPKRYEYVVDRVLGVEV
jgi:protein KIBRA